MEQCKSNRHVQFAGGRTYNWIYDPYYAQGFYLFILFKQLKNEIDNNKYTMGILEKNFPKPPTGIEPTTFQLQVWMF